MRISASSLLVIICFVKTFYELNIRFFGPAVSAVQSRPLASHSNISAKVREAGTLPRSPRFIWRETKPEAPRVRPSGTDTMLLFAARARAHRQHCDVWRSTPALERGGAEQLLCV